MIIIIVGRKYNIFVHEIKTSAADGPVYCLAEYVRCTPPIFTLVFSIPTTNWRKLFHNYSSSPTYTEYRVKANGHEFCMGVLTWKTPWYYPRMTRKSSNKPIISAASAMNHQSKLHRLKGGIWFRYVEGTQYLDRGLLHVLNTSQYKNGHLFVSYTGQANILISVNHYWWMW